MAETQRLQLHGQDESDEESDISDSITLQEDQPGTSTEKLALKKKRVKKYIEIASGDSTSKIIGMIDTFDREPNAEAEGPYSGAGAYISGFEDEPGKRIPKFGYAAEAGVGRAKAVFGVLDAEAKGPNAGVHAGVDVTKAQAMIHAEVASVSANAGPFGVKAGLAFDTGVSAGADGLELKVLGTGISFGPNTSISLLGSEVSCSVM